MASKIQPTIKNVNMTKNMEMYSINTAINALETLNNNQEVASYIKKKFDSTFGPSWHCFVGRNFGSYVTYEENNYIYFYIGQVGFLLFKSG